MPGFSFVLVGPVIWIVGVGPCPARSCRLSGSYRCGRCCARASGPTPTTGMTAPIGGCYPPFVVSFPSKVVSRPVPPGSARFRPAALPGGPARRPCPAALPGGPARRPCPARRPRPAARCPALPGPARPTRRPRPALPARRPDARRPDARRPDARRPDARPCPPCPAALPGGPMPGPALPARRPCPAARCPALPGSDCNGNNFPPGRKFPDFDLTS